MAEPITSSVTLTRQQAEDQQHVGLIARIAALEAELASLRQIVADVETCRGEHAYSIEILSDNEDAESIQVTTAVAFIGEQTGWTRKLFHAPTWQDALHAAAEHVRREGE